MKKISSLHMYLSIAILFVSIIICINLSIPIFYGIFISILYVLLISIINKYKFFPLLKISYNSFLTVKNVIFMMTLLGLIIPIWMSTGTIPSLISLGFKYLSKTNIVAAAFILCSILSIMLGSFIGTISTLIPVFMGLSVVMEVPLPLIVGAAVSGAVFGDRTSPVSSNVALNASSCDSPLINNLKSMLKTTIPAYLITLILYMILGKKYILKPNNINSLNSYINLIKSNFTTSFYVFIPVIVLFVMILVLRKTIVKSLIVSYIISAIIFMFQFNNFSLLVKTSLIGFYSSNSLINEVVSGSGLISMRNVILLIYASNYLNDLLKHLGLIEPLLEKFSNKIKSFKDLIYKTAFLSIIITTISCNQSLTTIVTGNHFKSIYEKSGINKAILSRTIADTGALIIPIIPWNANALIVVSLTSVKVLEYSEYAFFSYIPLVITLIYPLFYKKNLARNTI